LIEASSENGFAAAVTNAIERAQPVAARLVRVHDFLWLRIWKRKQTGVLPRREEVCDLVCVLAPKG